VTSASTRGKRPRAARRPGERPGQILEAAARVLERLGPAATIEEIAYEAGLGKGTVYEYFGSKAQILAALRRRYVEVAMAAGERAMPPGADPVAGIRAYVGGMFAFAVDNAPLVTLLFHDAGTDADDPLGLIAARLVDLVRGGGLDVADPEFTVEFLLHGLHGVLESALARGEPASRTLARLDPVITALLGE
jgi:AcrR family transcriptional regulator